MASISASILGASGYSGIELYGILLRHPRVRVRHLFAQSSAGKRVDELYPRFRSMSSQVFESYAPAKVGRDDVVFVALPSGEAMTVVPGMLERGARVIDLGGDFRLKDASQYTSYYKREHTAQEQLAAAVYSMPELRRASVAGAALVSNPGCYPTSAILPLAPLLKHGMIRTDGIVINALSGVSGAGRSSSVNLSFVEVDSSVKAYRVGTHQHTPEIESVLTDAAGSAVTVTFTPHLLPIPRGILTTITAPLTQSANADSVASCFHEAYANSPFVRLLGGQPPEIRNILHTNFIDIGWHLYPRNGQIILMSAIDNLVKGAAGQAVQNFNLLCGFDETEGLV